MHEASTFAAESKELTAPQRRNWSLREAAMFMVVQADRERTTELRALGETLVANAHRLIGLEREHRPIEVVPAAEVAEQQLVRVRAWASSLERDRYEINQTQDGFSVQATPPDDVAQALKSSNEDLELATEATRLFVRYPIDPTKESAKPIGHDELTVDMATARKLLENAPSHGVLGPWDTSALVAAAALKAYRKRLFPPLLSVSCGVHHLLGRHLHSGRLSCLGLAMVLLCTLRCIRLISAAGSRR